MDFEFYIERCIQLAKLAKGQTFTNPLVGALLVYNDQIIGEGYHTAFGAPHGEIEAMNNVPLSDRKWIPESTLFVNLEPCVHYGKTPPCTDEIIRQGIKRVVIGTADPNPRMQGKGIEKLKHRGTEVITPVLEKQCHELNQVFFTNMSRHRPFIQLKYACSQDNFIGNYQSAVPISNSWSKYIVHKIRHEVDGILIGTRTAINDDPQLTNRNYFGKNPVRMVLDRTGKIPLHYQIFSDGLPTWIFTDSPNRFPSSVRIIPWMDDLNNTMSFLLDEGIGSLLVEGGAQTLQSFINGMLWDEIWVTQTRQALGDGVSAPHFRGNKVWEMDIDEETLSVYRTF